ncbi:YbaB/EbfC DNA-binding family protein [Lentzea albidocapillata subsp. violacea]|uniref:YbaB/EbfC DNA-binding family protein n=1 Tax=Lentzea albidocapillata subsp. violacea TaxID=128104 RepID=A0A1G8UMM0_9PSEU|nr:YbaB/EbfC family nucleoid-associated protein [Lentzea albidocapillata]SDJ55033.1 YbaB/EbfC DNA-binding family protein [Lentzea albidocapillata subsp. violacea]
MNPANPYQWVEEYEAKLADLKQKSEDLTENFAASSATVTSKDGAVTVTVGPNGGLQNLQLGHRAVELGGSRLTALILETARAAQKQAAQQVLELFKPLGEGTEAYQMVSDSIPDDEAEEDTDPYDEVDDEPEPAPAPPVSRPAAAPQPAAAPRRRRADDEDDDDNQPW